MEGLFTADRTDKSLILSIQLYKRETCYRSTGDWNCMRLELEKVDFDVIVKVRVGTINHQGVLI